MVSWKYEPLYSLLQYVFPTVCISSGLELAFVLLFPSLIERKPTTCLTMTALENEGQVLQCRMLLMTLPFGAVIPEAVAEPCPFWCRW